MNEAHVTYLQAAQRSLELRKMELDAARANRTRFADPTTFIAECEKRYGEAADMVLDAVENMRASRKHFQ